MLVTKSMFRAINKARAAFRRYDRKMDEAKIAFIKFGDTTDPKAAQKARHFKRYQRMMKRKE